MGAFDDYTTLKATLAGWVHRGDVNAAATGRGVDNAVAAWITLFEAYASRKLREWNTEKVANLAVAAEYVTAPTDMLELKSMVLTDGITRWPLEPAPQWVVDRSVQSVVQSTRPDFFAMVAGQFRFFPTPDKAYTAILTYYAGLTPLSVAAPSNWLLKLAPDAYLYGALTAGAPYLKDMASLPVWRGLRDEAMQGVMESQRQPSARLRNEYASPDGKRGWNVYSDQ